MKRHRHASRAGALLALALLAPSLAACRAGIGGSPTPLAEADAAAREAIAGERALGAATAPAAGTPRTVAVVPLRAATADLEPLGFALADLLLTDLSRSSQLRVVERAQLHALLRELQLTSAGRVDSATAPRTGRLLRASDLVVGGVAPAAEGALRVDSRVADVATGRVDVAVSADARLDDILAAEKELAFRVIERLGVTLTPAERAAIEARPTGSLAALLAYGRAVRYEVEGNYAAAAAEYARAARVDPGFGAARERTYDLRAHADVWPLPVVPVGASAAGPAGFTSSGGTLGGSMVDRINRPFALGTTTGGSSSPADPSFPASQATIIITVVLP